MIKKRLIYFLLICITIPLGLATRSNSIYLPNLIKEYGGDILYATCMFSIIRFVTIKTSLPKVALYSFIICVGVELLQLYKEPWMEKLRHTFPMGLILGYGFLLSDLICYLIGVILAFAAGFYIEKQYYRNPSYQGN